MKSTFFRVLAQVLVLACFAPHVHAADRSKDLPPHYRHWLNQEVNYIIDSNERKVFLSLKTDAQRDSFIDGFWRIRNPDPGSPINTYKEEIYRRLAYVNEHYGDPAVQDGWHTDMGRIYIILGPPQQVMTYPSARNVRPLVIWFYQSPSPALPPYFNIMFYKRSAGEPYTLYSPGSDGPVRLVTGLEALNDQKRSFAELRESLGDEVASISLCLIPGVPVDFDFQQYDPDMASDLMLSTIAGLPDNPLTQEKLNTNRLRERVTTSIFLGEHDTTLSYNTFRDDRGRMTLSYLLQMQFANPHLVGARADGSSYYDMLVRTDIQTAAGKPVYSQEDRLTANLTPAAAEVARKKRFGAEVRLPLEPGIYKLTSTLTNNVDQVATREQAMVTVPEPKKQGIAISGLLAFSKPAGIPDPHDLLPFSGSHYRFTPRGAQNVYIRQGDQLPLVFQLWLDPKTAPDTGDEKIHMHYVFGSIADASNSATREDEDLDAGNRDAAGNLLTGHTLDTSGLMPGNYQVAVTATRESDQKTAFATLDLHVAPQAEYVDTWTAYGPVDPGGDALDDLKRGMAAEALGADAEALNDFQRGLHEGGDIRVLDRLAVLLARKGMTDQLAALSQQPVLARTAASPSTLMLIAAALNKEGNPKDVVRMLETQITLQPPTPELYNVLADACQASGNTGRAHELRDLAANLKK